MSTFDNLDKNSGDQNSSCGWSSSVLHLPTDSSNCKLGESCAPDSHTDCRKIEHTMFSVDSDSNSRKYKGTNQNSRDHTPSFKGGFQ